MACHAASFSANGRVYAGDDDGSTSVAIAGVAPHRKRARRGLPVEAHERERGRGAAHARGFPGRRIADRAVEAALPPARDDRVPETDAACAQRDEPPAIRHLGQRHAGHGRDQRPEVIARMRVVLAGGERRCARESCRG